MSDQNHSAAYLSFDFGCYSLDQLHALRKLLDFANAAMYEKDHTPIVANTEEQKLLDSFIEFYRVWLADLIFHVHEARHNKLISYFPGHGSSCNEAEYRQKI